MLYYTLKELSPEEKKLPLARFYEDYPLFCLPPHQRQILDNGPLDPNEVIDVHHWMDILQRPGEYNKLKLGYCMMPDGSGYYCENTVIPTMDPMKKRWFMKWINYRSKNMPEDQGNLRYKLWCPIDHWDRGFRVPDDPTSGSYAIGRLDQGKTEPWEHAKEYTHSIDLVALGLDPEYKKELEDIGCRISASWEDFEGEPGHHMWVHIDRPCPWGGTEMIGIEWIGYYVKDGQIVQDKETPCSEEYLKDVLTHNIVEHIHLPQILPDLYEEYHDKPLDAD